MSKTLFDHLNQIFEKKDRNYFDSLSDADKKSYNSYMINRFISMNLDYLPLVNLFQQYWGQTGQRESFLFYSSSLPKKKQFNKYIKSSSEYEDYEPWLLQLIAKHYSVSLTDANQYLKIYYSSTSGKVELKDLLCGYGVDSKMIKKARLG